MFDGKVITGSRYMTNGKLSISKDFDQNAWIYAQNMVDLYQPSRGFVIDVGLVDGEWKIVELNCFNSAGFYHSDVKIILSSLTEDHERDI